MLEAENVDVVGIASRTREKAEQFASQFGLERAYSSYDELLSDTDIEAVHIPLPNSMHVPWAIKAIEAGKHVLSEKPLAVSPSAILELMRVADGKSLKVMEAFMWRLHPQHKKARQLIDDGSLGKVTYFRGSFTYVREDKPDIRIARELGGGSLLDVGCYPVSCARFYMGSEPTRVYATGERHPVYDVDTRVSCLLEFPAGTAQFDCGFHLPYRTDVEIAGESGRIYIPRAWQPHEQAQIYLNDEEITLPPCNHYVELFDYFSRCVLEDREIEFGLHDSLAQSRVLEAIEKSLSSNSPVDVVRT